MQRILFTLVASVTLFATARAQQFDHPVTIPISYVGNGVLSAPGGNFSFGAELGPSTTASGTYAGQSVTSPEQIGYVVPGKDYNIYVSTDRMGMVTAKFNAGPNRKVYINGVKTTSFGKGVSALEPDFSFRLRVECEDDARDSLIGLRTGASTSFPTDKPIWYLGLGQLRNGRPAGAVGFRAETITDALFSPSSLIYDSPDITEILVERDTNAYIKTITTRDAIVSVQTLTSTSYRILVSNILTPGTPYITYTISKYVVTGGTGIRIDRLEDGKNWSTVLKQVGGTWTLLDWRVAAAATHPLPETIAVTTVQSGSTAVVTYGSGEGSYKKTKTYTTINGRKELSSLVMGDTVATLPG